MNYGIIKINFASKYSSIFTVIIIFLLFPQSAYASGIPEGGLIMVILLPALIILSAAIALFVKYGLIKLIPKYNRHLTFTQLLNVAVGETVIIFVSLFLFLGLTTNSYNFELGIINYFAAIAPDAAYTIIHRVFVKHEYYLFVVVKSFIFVFILFFVNAIPTLTFMKFTSNNKKRITKFIQACCLGIIAPVIFCISINIININPRGSQEILGKFPNARDYPKQLQILLYNTVRAGYPRLVDLVIDKGADINSVGNRKSTALHLAVRQPDNIAVVKYLLDKGIDIDHKSNDGYTALILACSKSKTSPEMIQLLINHGADINEQANNGHTALIAASGRTKGRPPMFGSWSTEIEKTLIENGADVNIQSKDGKTALMAAVKANNLDVVKLLLNNGAHVNVKDKNGKTAYVLSQSYKMKALLSSHGGKEH